MKLKGTVKSKDRQNMDRVSETDEIVVQLPYGQGAFTFHLSPGQSRAYRVGRRIDIEVKPK